MKIKDFENRIKWSIIVLYSKSFQALSFKYLNHVFLNGIKGVLNHGLKYLSEKWITHGL